MFSGRESDPHLSFTLGVRASTLRALIRLQDANAYSFPDDPFIKHRVLLLITRICTLVTTLGEAPKSESVGKEASTSTTSLREDLCRSSRISPFPPLPRLHGVDGGSRLLLIVSLRRPLLT